jgi:hypothetical protein
VAVSPDHQRSTESGSAPPRRPVNCRRADRATTKSTTYHGIIRWILNAPMVSQILPRSVWPSFFARPLRPLWGVDFHPNLTCVKGEVSEHEVTVRFRPH